jgi:hypothetical protein
VHSYQFILNPKNTLYLVAVHRIQNNTAHYVPCLEYEMWDCFANTGIRFPQPYHEVNYSAVREKYCSIHSNAECMGVMMTNAKTGERTRMLNPNYLEKKEMEKINDNLLYHFLLFLYINKVENFIEFFPQYTIEFASFQKHYNTFVKGIYLSYLDFYVFRKVGMISVRYAHHISYLHYSYYLMKREKITFDMVERYVSEMEPYVILQCLYSF